MQKHALTHPLPSPQYDNTTDSDEPVLDVQIVTHTMEELQAALVVARRRETEANATVAMLKMQLNDVTAELHDLVDVALMFGDGMMTPKEAFDTLLGMLNE